VILPCTRRARVHAFNAHALALASHPPPQAPFWEELVPDKTSKVLVPGVGNDVAIVELFDTGYSTLSCFDYAPEGVARARELFGDTRLKSPGGGGGTVDLRVADARSLPYGDSTFDAVFEKGTLDSVFLSGGKDKKVGTEQLRLAVSELSRVVRNGGIVMSVSTPATRYIDTAFAAETAGDGRPRWKQLRDGDVHITADGFATINVDATILAWERTS